jgi:hypothetical protein
MYFTFPLSDRPARKHHGIHRFGSSAGAAFAFRVRSSSERAAPAAAKYLGLLAAFSQLDKQKRSVLDDEITIHRPSVLRIGADG